MSVRKRALVAVREPDSEAELQNPPVCAANIHRQETAASIPVTPPGV